MKNKVQNAWAFYDWANSVYSLVISTAVFPIYFEAVTRNASEANTVQFLGFELMNSTLYSYSLSISFIIVAIISPILSGIADHTGAKKQFLRFFCYLGAISCGLLFFFVGDNIAYGLAASVLASIGFWGSLVFYNAFLPQIATPNEQDKLSAKGFSLGYIGSSLLLIFILIMTQYPESFGFSDTLMATRASFILTGIWWLAFGQLSLHYLPDNQFKKKASRDYIWKGFEQIKAVISKLKDLKNLRNYLYSYFLFSVGVQTVILLASLFGSVELELETSKLITTILIIQFVGIAGALIFSRLSHKIGNLGALKLSIAIWAIICFGAFTLDKNDTNIEVKFYLLGATVGLVMGGIQSLGRSTYSKLLPKGTKNTASFFSFYDVTEKIAIVIGTITYGYLIDLTGSMTMSVLSLSIFFVLAFLQMLRVKKGAYVY